MKKNHYILIGTCVAVAAIAAIVLLKKKKPVAPVIAGTTVLTTIKQPTTATTILQSIIKALTTPVNSVIRTAPTGSTPVDVISVTNPDLADTGINTNNPVSGATLPTLNL